MLLTEEYITSGRFGKIIGVSEDTIRSWNKSGKLKSVGKSEGGFLLYKHDQIEEAKKLKRKPKFLEGYNLIDDEKGLKLTEFNAYIAGLFYSDGFLDHYDGLNWYLKDREILEQIAKRFNPTLNITKHKTRNVWYCHIPISYSDSNLQLFNKESFCHMLRGWFDGDGCVSVRNKGKQKGQMRFHITGHERMLGCIQKTLIENFNIYLPFYSNNKNKKPEFGNFETSQVDILSQLFYIIYKNETISLQRKKILWSEYLKNKAI